MQKDGSIFDCAAGSNFTCAKHRDDEVKGFGLRVTAGSMSFICERRVSGKVQRRTIGRADLLSVEEARKQARRMLAEMAAGTPHAQTIQAPTLAEVLAEYPTKKRLRESTITNYRQVVRRYLPDWEQLPVTAITKEMVFARHRQLGDQVSGNYANLIMQVLRTLLYFAMEHYETPDGQPIILVNPVSKLSKNQMWYRKRRRQGVIPDHKLSDWYRAVMACTSTNVRDYLLLLITTGLRRNEAATLRWVDIDFEARTMAIREEIAKNHREHKLPLSDFLFELLSRRRNEIADSEYVFPGRYGGHMVSYIRQIQNKVVAQSNCPFVLHDLRRTFISMAAKLGIQHHLTKRLLNHIGDKDDTDEYIVISTEHLREPMEQISRRFLELMGADLAHWGVYPEYRANYRAITLQEVLDAYLKVHSLSPNSERAYRSVIRQRLSDWLDLPVTAITSEMVERRHQQISTIGTPPWQASKVQANQAMSTLGALLNWAADTYQVDGKPLIASNPVRALRRNGTWNYVPARESVVPDGKLSDWYRAVISITATTPRDMLLVSMFAGLCHADVVNLTWGDVDLEAKVVNVRTKHGRLHRVPMSDFLHALFRHRYEHSKSKYVFPGRAGGPIKQYSEVMEKAWKVAGFHFTIQDLRRTFLSVAERLDLPLYAVRALQNRSQRRSQLGSHAEFDIDELRKPMQRITDKLLELMAADEYLLGFA